MSTLKRISSKISYPGRCMSKCSVKIYRDITGKNSGTFKPDNKIKEADREQLFRYSKLPETTEDAKVQSEDETETDTLSTYMYVPDYILQRALRIRDAHVRARSEAESDEGRGSSSSSNEYVMVGTINNRPRWELSDYESEKSGSENSLFSEVSVYEEVALYSEDTPL